MKPRNLIIAVVVALSVFFFLTRESEKPVSRVLNKTDEIQVISSRENAADYQPDLESYRFEREGVQLSNNIAGPRLKPEFAGMPTYKQSNLRLKVPAGPIDDYGAPLFVPSETAMTDPRVFEQELAKHKERSESYAAARMDELKLNTGVEREQMRAVIDQAQASGSKPPEEIKRAEAAYDRLAILEKVLKGEKVDKILD